MAPLAERMRPRSLADVAGQEHLMAEGSPFRVMVESGKLHSMIFWGPPGVGKTTLARLIANLSGRPFFELSAISAGVKDVRDAIAQAEKQQFFNRASPILFIDEIHRFSKSQQDALLGAVEKGIVVLIGATTENPSFEVISALLSRTRVYVLKPLEESHMIQMLQRAIDTDTEFKSLPIELLESDALIAMSGGDGRKLYNALEIVVQSMEDQSPITVNNALVMQVLQEKMAIYDKSGEMHYDIISAFIKSVRGSDPDASLYYLARMLEAGEKIEFIARRLIILAAEDIGLANPNALLLATQGFDAIRIIGMPEARIVLAEITIYLATSQKSNSAYLAIEKAMAYVRENPYDPVPLHLRNAPTALMKKLDYGKSYLYPHDYPEHYIKQQYLPDKVIGKKFYEAASNNSELKSVERFTRPNDPKSKG
jgi:putative ATPase